MLALVGGQALCWKELRRQSELGARRTRPQAAEAERGLMNSPRRPENQAWRCRYSLLIKK